MLDTHAWIWWVDDPRRLSQRARTAIETADRIGVSAISCWEVGTLVARGRLALDRDVRVWVDQALTRERVEPLPVSPTVALAAAMLDRQRFPLDPADRVVYSTALAEHRTLVTKDRLLRAYDPDRTLW
ncbi:MAG: type II toxin-antitoxin system VapC family toxin [Gaiellaceae bacterium MAG52_C11]|nr:type II toxin-antitoxin system VapC family toxin [Candidatus Gaiellasilicea maunaloa]